MDFSQQFENTKNSVINVLALDSNNNPVSSGSGVLIGGGNLALTCNHCIIPGTTTVARFSGENNGQKGNIIYQNQASDIALIEFPKNIGKPATIRSSDTVLVGHEAYILGFPNNIDKITALSANVAGFEPSNGYNLIRLDSSINHGNSGGPIFNSSGEVIGICNAKHGSLSQFLNDVEAIKDDIQMAVGGVNAFEVLQRLIGEMKRNLILGIGYAIPSSHIAGIINQVNAVIQK